MRQIVNISLPKELYTEVEKAVRTEKFASKSEFFRHLLRLWREDQLYRNVQKSRKEYGQGKAKKLISLKNLQ